MDHVRSIKCILTCGNIQASNMRRKLADTKREMVDDTLQILRTRRRLLRMEKVRHVVSNISESLKADDGARRAVVVGDFICALMLTQGARIMLETSTFSELVILNAAQTRLHDILPKLISMVNNALEKMIKDHNTFDDALYADIVTAYIALDEAEEEGWGLNSLASHVATYAVAQIEALKNGKKHSVATTTALLCTSVIKILQIINACALWHSSVCLGRYEHLSRVSGALRTPGDNDRIRSTGRRLLQILGDVWHHARRVVVEEIAASLPISNDQDVFDGRRRPRLADIALAMESLEAARRFAAKNGCFDLKFDTPSHYNLIRELICVPYLYKLRTEAFDSLRQMLSSEPWIRLDVHGGDDPRTAFSDLVLKHGSESAVFHGFQRYALQCVQVTLLLDGVAFDVLETLFGLSKTYLAAIASVHLPIEGETSPPCGRPSAHLAQLLATIFRKTAKKAAEFKDVEGAIVAAESLSFACEVLSCATNAILLQCEHKDHRHTAVKDGLKIYESLAMELRIGIFGAIGSRLADVNAIASIISNLGARVWLSSIIKEECNGFVPVLANKLSTLWHSLLNADDREVFNDTTRELIWTHTAQAVFQAFVDGFSKVVKCSTEGRALMSMDLQVLQSSLDKIHRVRPPRGAAYVDSYIKAWYFSQPDLKAWIVQNEGNYCRCHLDALLKARSAQGGDW